MCVCVCVDILLDVKFTYIQCYGYVENQHIGFGGNCFNILHIISQSKQSNILQLHNTTTTHHLDPRLAQISVLMSDSLAFY